MDKKDNNIEHRKFVSLLMPNQTRIQAFILTLVPNINDAEDIYQETVATMWDKIAAFEEGTNFAAWAVTIAKYKVLEFRAKHKKSKIQFNDAVFEKLETAATSRTSMTQDRLDALGRCIRKLSQKEMHLLKMRYEQGFTFQKISLVIGKTPPAVHRTIALIQSKLSLCVRRFLSQEGVL